MKMAELKQIVESLGCEIKLYTSWIFIMLPIEFPWYGKQDDADECDNSRIIAQVANAFGPVKWLDAWPVPTISNDRLNGKPLGLNMRKMGRCFTYMQDFDSEEFTDWLQSKIEEVSEKAKECRKLMIAYKSKEYEA